MNKTEAKRTSVVLSDADQIALREVCDLQGGISETEAIRRSLRLAAELLTFSKKDGGRIVLEKGKDREQIRFL
jgi:hypothetical protein